MQQAAGRVSDKLPHYPPADSAADGCGLIAILMLAAIALMLCAAAVWWLA
jgi:hypothetical protein